jgi:hypothetical protein
VKAAESEKDGESFSGKKNFIIDVASKHERVKS